VLRVHLSPDVVLRVPYPADTGSYRAAEHAEAVGPFANTASARPQQLPNIRIPGESLVGTAAISGTAVQLDSGGATGGLFGARGRHALGDGRHAALGARGVVDELKEGSLEPSGKQGMLVTLGGFGVHEGSRPTLTMPE
jgi:hypothetical protein